MMKVAEDQAKDARHVWEKTMKKCLILWVLFTHSVVVAGEFIRRASPYDRSKEYDRRLDCTVYNRQGVLPYTHSFQGGYVIGRSYKDDSQSDEKIEYGYALNDVGRWCANLKELDAFIKANKARPGRDSWGEMRPNVRQAFFRITQGVDFRILKTIDGMKGEDQDAFEEANDYRKLVNEIVPAVYIYCGNYESMQKLMRQAYPDIETTSEPNVRSINNRPKISFEWQKGTHSLDVDEILKLAMEIDIACSFYSSYDAYRLVDQKKYTN
jgi:hypothetical protein